MQTVTLSTGETLTFSEAEHLYLCNGEPMPGTHSLMERHQIVKPLDQFSAPYAERGKRIHFITQAWDENDLDRDDVDSLDRGYLDAWVRFKEKHNVTKWDGIEGLRGSAKYWYATVIDRWGEVDGQLWTINQKTGKPAKWHSVQLHLEAMLLGHPDKIMAIYLAPDGEFCETDYTDDRDSYDLALQIITTNGLVHSWKRGKRGKKVRPESIELAGR